MATFCHSFQTKSGQIPSDSVRIQGPSKRSSSGLLYPVSSVKECNRKGGNVKSLRFYSHLFLLPKPHQRWRPVIDLSRLNTQNGNSRVHQDFPDSRRMGIVDRPIGCLRLRYPHPPKLKEITKVLPQVRGVPVHLPPFWTSHSPQVFTMIVKEVKLMALSRGLRLHQYLDDWLIRSQSQEEAQVNTLAVVDKSGKFRTKANSCVFRSWATNTI